jgi:hypothetical protein
MNRFLKTADRSPKMTPRTTANIMEEIASSMVAGRNSIISVITGRPLTREFPRFPRNIPPR